MACLRCGYNLTCNYTPYNSGYQAVILPYSYRAPPPIIYYDCWSDVNIKYLFGDNWSNLSKWLKEKFRPRQFLLTNKPISWLISWLAKALIGGQKL